VSKVRSIQDLLLLMGLHQIDAGRLMLYSLPPSNTKHWHIFHIVARKSAAR